MQLELEPEAAVERFLREYERTAEKPVPEQPSQEALALFPRALRAFGKTTGAFAAQRFLLANFDAPLDPHLLSAAVGEFSLLAGATFADSRFELSLGLGWMKIALQVLERVPEGFGDSPCLEASFRGLSQAFDAARHRLRGLALRGEGLSWRVSSLLDYHEERMVANRERIQTGTLLCLENGSKEPLDGCFPRVSRSGGF